MTRLLDVIISFMALLVLWPIFLIIGLWIILSSPGSAFYLQERIGKNGVPFKLYKFRSMRPDADKLGQLTVGGRDPRITRIGYILRKYKLDELPQLINVLIGDMSIVGPRPEVKKYVDLYTPNQRKVLSVRPGITDIASIEFSNENEILGKSADPEKEYIENIMPKKIALNQMFISNPSLGNYLNIIWQTARKIWS